MVPLALREQELAGIRLQALQRVLQRLRRPDLVALRRAPEQAVGTERPQVARINAAAAERFDERDAIVQVIVRHGIGVGGDHRAQELAERDVDRRAVVERANAHRQHVLRRLRRFGGEPRRPGPDAARRAAGRRCRRWRAGAGRRCACRRCRGTRRTPRRRGWRRARAAASVVSYSAGSGLCGRQLLVAGSILPIASRSAPRSPLDAAELAGQLAEQVLLVAQVAARARDLVPQDLREREVLQQRDDVGERLVKGADVGVGRLQEVPVHAVEQRMRGLVRDDVVRQAGEDHAAGHVIAGVVLDRLEVAEEQRDFAAASNTRSARAAHADTRAAAGTKTESFFGCGPAGGGPGRHRLRRPSARSKLRMVRLATAYTICWWNCGVPSLGASPSCASTSDRRDRPARRSSRSPDRRR